MSVLWERLAGDTSAFALRLSFLRDPDEGSGATPEESASWGAFQIWVAGQNLCAHVEEGETVESVHWYLLPLLEWLASSWDALLHEEKIPAQHRLAKSDAISAVWILRETRFLPSGSTAIQTAEQWQGYWNRHALRSCREGGLFPDVYLRRWRHQIEVSWGDTVLPGPPSNFRFTNSSGISQLDPMAVAEPLYEVLHESSAHLQKRLPESGRIKQLVERIRALREQSEDKRLAWLAGIGTTQEQMFSQWTKLRNEVAQFSYNGKDAADAIDETFSTGQHHPLVIQGSCHAALMFGSVAPTLKQEDVLRLARDLIQLFNPNKDKHPIDLWVRSEPVATSGTKAWEQGVRLAEEFSEAFQVIGPNTRWVNIVEILDNLGVNVEEVELSDTSIRAVSIAGPRHRPAVLINKMNRINTWSPSRRFTLAHELCHLLWDRDHGSKLAVASGPWAPRDIEKRANAWAAMLLMPRSLIERALDETDAERNSLPWLMSIAGQLRTSLSATLEHLSNQGFIDEVAHDILTQEIDALAASK